MIALFANLMLILVENRIMSMLKKSLIAAAVAAIVSVPAFATDATTTPATATGTNATSTTQATPATSTLDQQAGSQKIADRDGNNGHKRHHKMHGKRHHGNGKSVEESHESATAELHEHEGRKS
jgi:hypothetical protein